MIDWRPKGWEVPELYIGLLDNLKQDAYEAGATAILEALKEAGEYVDASKAPYGYVFNNIATYPRTFKGWFILIPEVP